MLKKTTILALAGFITALTVGTVTAQVATDKAATPNATTTTEAPVDMKKLSEAFGHFIGRNLKSPGVSFDMDSIIKGIREGAEGKPAPMSEQEYEKMMIAVQKQAFSTLAETNLKAAEEFFAKNAKESGVKTLVPGQLQILVLQEGKGPSVEEHGTPSIKYTAKYLDGTVFDSSEAAGGPITISLDQTIPGFSKGIVGMKEGEKRRIFVHPDLAYGKSGQLPPNSALIFDVELVKAKGDVKDLHDDADEEDEVIILEKEPAQNKK